MGRSKHGCVKRLRLGGRKIAGRNASQNEEEEKKGEGTGEGQLLWNSRLAGGFELAIRAWEKLGLQTDGIAWLSGACVVPSGGTGSF